MFFTMKALTEMSDDQPSVGSPMTLKGHTDKAIHPSSLPLTTHPLPESSVMDNFPPVHKDELWFSTMQVSTFLHNPECTLDTRGIKAWLNPKGIRTFKVEPVDRHC